MTPQQAELKTSVQKLITECQIVLSFAQRWEPLSPGDISDLRRAVDAVVAALAGAEPPPPAVAPAALVAPATDDALRAVWGDIVVRWNAMITAKLNYPTSGDLLTVMGHVNDAFREALSLPLPETPDAAAPPVAAPERDGLLKRAVHDRDMRPWRYYQLDAAALQKCCEHLADKLAACEAKTQQDSLQNAPVAAPAVEGLPACPNCGGVGETTHDILVGGTEHDTEQRDCDVCKGSGIAPPIAPGSAPAAPTRSRPPS